MFGVNAFGQPYFAQGPSTEGGEPVIDLPAAGLRRTWVLTRLTDWLLPVRRTAWKVERKTDWTV